MTPIALCALADLQARSGKAFVLEQYQPPLEIFVVEKNGALFAYYNQCPHTGVTLNWQADQFMDICGELIQCAMHGALFRIEDGYCVRGPCAGASLKSLALSVRNATLYVLPEEGAHES